MDIVVDIVDNHFNPRLREGGDFSSLSSVDGETISIHASAKEATMDRLSLLVRAKISIHASAKEATSLHMLIHLSYLDFNPRLREGGDRNIL